MSSAMPTHETHEQTSFSNKRQRLEPVDMNGAQINHEREPEAEHHTASSDQPQKTIENGTQCAETGDVPLPTHSSHDLEEIHQHLSVTNPPISQHKLVFANGLFLAPMVRIGALPTRLLSLQYGADLVWSPEIVDRAIIGCDRTVNEKTGLIAYSREGRHIFTTHPIERDRLIFQLGSSSPEWAYKAIKFITAHNEVAGVDLNCGCPKSFSTIGGMGAQLLSTPDLLCDILRAMRIAAPPHVSVTCKIRLLPTKEETQNLVRKIVRTNCIDALTLHCRTKTMRPREPALPHRLQEVKEIVDEESGGKLPLICNGDAWDASEAQNLMQKTGVSAVMMARGPEGNPSCFRAEGLLSVPEIIAPEWVKLAIALDNQYGNTKYCLQSLAMKPSSSIVPGAPPLKTNRLQWNKQKLGDLRASVSQAKSVDDMASALGVDANEVRSREIDEILKEVSASLDKNGRKSKNTLFKIFWTTFSAFPLSSMQCGNMRGAIFILYR
ncbi:hypothetical protein L7F22_009206 [Adiantum nelumboides]|nr:hypothetical protein [Adiantum nelumboides]